MMILDSVGMTPRTALRAPLLRHDSHVTITTTMSATMEHERATMTPAGNQDHELVYELSEEMYHYESVLSTNEL